MREIDFSELSLNPLEMIGDNWMLLSAGDGPDHWNTMTISWGSLGSLWHLPGHKGNGGMPTATVYVRPQRYTKKFMDECEYFTLSLLPPAYRKDLTYLGSHSGRNEDKMAHTSLHPAFSDNTAYIQEASLVLICRKLYHGKMEEADFADKDLIDANYPQKDYHDIYIGEIVKTLVDE